MRANFVPCAVAVIAAAAAVSVAAAAGPPPPPTSVSGHTVTVLARGVPTPTAFAFGAGQTFVAGFGDEQHPNVKGGVYRLAGGTATRLPGSPAHVFGRAYGDGTLYVSGDGRIFAWSGWDGSRFAKSRVVASAGNGFTGFNGIALGPGGNLYAGITLGPTKADDYSRGNTPYANSVVVVDPHTDSITWFATGMRQPWQPLFVPGLGGVLVSDLGQENLGKKRPVDEIVELQEGADFGFPACPANPATCRLYDKPFATFPAHSSPMGLATIGNKLYVALFNGTGKGPEVVSMPLRGGQDAPALVGFAAPVVALAAHDGELYAGDLTGGVYVSAP